MDDSQEYKETKRWSVETIIYLFSAPLKHSVSVD
ncbi:hypothetical protein IGL76_002250 [Enterococcus sp. DIV2381]|uniref:Uncharacterized protein n=1 Tax=Candidatus Enterococcus mangumiae TaxID=2230878 RepID=A0ABZ2SXR8_9ENTE